MDEATSLFKFKAGKSRLDGKLLKADTRKGMVEVLRVRLVTPSDSNGLGHWTCVWQYINDQPMPFPCRTRTVLYTSLGASGRQLLTLPPGQSQKSTWSSSQARPHSHSWAAGACFC